MSKNEELAKALTHGMFATPPTLKQAFKDAYSYIDRLRKEDRIIGLLVLHCTMNTVAVEIEKNTLKEM